MPFFSVNSRFIKEIVGWPKAGPVSAIFSRIFMSKMEEDVIVPAKSIFCQRYVDDTHVDDIIRKNIPFQLRCLQS